MGSPTRSIRARLLLTAIVLAGAGGYALFGRASTRPTTLLDAKPPTEPIASARHSQWYDENLSSWESLEYVSLSDRQLLRQTVGELVAGRHSGPPCDEDLFIRDLSDFLYALAAQEPKEYLARFGEPRRFVSHPLSDRGLQLKYHYLTGRPIPDNTPAQALFESFWYTKANVVGRPAKLATTALIQFAWTNPRPKDRLGNDEALAFVTFPKFSMYDNPANLNWLGFASQALPKLTEITSSFEEQFAREGRALICESVFAVRTTDDRIVVLEAAFFFSTTLAAWDVLWVANKAPFFVFWPI